MKMPGIIIKHLFITLVAIMAVSATVRGEESPKLSTYPPQIFEVMKFKVAIDDPRNMYETMPLKKIVPPEIYSKFAYDENKTKDLWAEAVGFRSPDVVGKISPQIKPGKYTYKDVETIPGFKELFDPVFLERIKPGGPPFVANIPEFEIIPTRQWFYTLPIAEATKKNAGKTRLDQEGYLVPESYEAGFPFPKPDGPQKAQQVVYDLKTWYKDFGNNCATANQAHGYTKDLKEDSLVLDDAFYYQLAGRVIFEPYGFANASARKNFEFSHILSMYRAPRDLAGTVYDLTWTFGKDTLNNSMIYVPSLRRVRKLSASDGQDPVAGSDRIFDDFVGIGMQLNPKVFPWKFEIIDEREFLFPVANGSEYLDSKDGYAVKNVTMERRPCYVVKMTQQDPNYAYRYRIVYIDKETFIHYSERSYNQKGRLYRSSCVLYSLIPDMGSVVNVAYMDRDHVDLHSNYSLFTAFPTNMSSSDVSLKAVLKEGK